MAKAHVVKLGIKAEQHASGRCCQGKEDYDINNYA